MRRLTKNEDAFGLEMWAYLNGGEPYEVVERDDGYISAAPSTGEYFDKFNRWSKRQRAAIRLVRGKRALDIGCGAGRVSLFLQEKGVRVTAIDNSPLAIRVCKKRGLKDARLLPFEEIQSLSTSNFDTVIMFGNNFGLCGNSAKAKKLLKQLHVITTDDALILAEGMNPYQTANPSHLEYRRMNRNRGRMAGQMRIRIRFQKCVGRWIDYLFVSPDEMKNILRGTGWKVRRIIEDDSLSYVALIEKMDSSSAK